MIWNFYISHIKLLHFHHKCPFSNAHKNNNNKRTFILWRCRIHWMYERGLAQAPNSQLSNDFVLSWLRIFVSSPSRTFFRRKMNDFGTEKSTREDVTKVHNHGNNWIFYNFQNFGNSKEEIFIFPRVCGLGYLNARMKVALK